MGKVIDGKDRFLPEQAFLFCTCGIGEPTLMPVVRFVAGLPLIVSLVCEKCEREYPVEDGYVYEPDGDAS